MYLKLLILTVIIFFIPIDGFCWSEKINIKIAEICLEFMPTYLKMLMKKHNEELIRGIKEANSIILQKYTDRSGENKIDFLIELSFKEGEKIIDLIRQQKPFKEVIFHFGKCASFISFANDPLFIMDDDANEIYYSLLFYKFVEINISDFRIAFYGYEEKPFNRAEIERRLTKSLNKLGDFYPQLSSSFIVEDRLISPQSLNHQSIPFGIASICISNSVNDVANIWLIIWKSAGGEVSGLRYPLK